MDTLIILTYLLIYLLIQARKVISLFLIFL